MSRTLLFFSLSLLFLLLTASKSYAQTFDWGFTIGGPDVVLGYIITTDKAGNSYISGHFNQQVDFDPGLGVTQLSTSSTNASNTFIEKLDAQGNFQWVVKFGERANNIYISSIVVDELGNLFCTGSFRDSIDFDPGPASNYLVSDGGPDVFILKLDSSGNLLWVKSFGGLNGVSSYSIELDSLKNIYIGGSFADSCDFDPSTSSNIVRKVGDSSVADNPYILKLDSNSNFLWVKTIHGSKNIYPYDIDVDPIGNVYSTGWYAFDSVDFDPGNGTFYLTANYDAIYALKLDPNGNFLWAKTIQGVNNGYANTPRNIIADGTTNIYLTGRFRDTVDSDPGLGSYNLISDSSSYDIFVIKMTSSGSFVWGKSFGGSKEDFCSSTIVDDHGSIYTTGMFSGTTDLDPSNAVDNHTAVNLTDCFLQKMDSNGSFQWAVSYGGSSFDQVTSLDVDQSGNIYSSGYYSIDIDIDPGPVSSIRNAIGNVDMFVQRLSQTSTGLIDYSTLNDDLLIYPNPSNDFINLELKESMYAVTLSLSDLSGKVVYSKYFERLEKTQIELPLVEGIYILNLQTEEKNRVLKVVKQ